MQERKLEVRILELLGEMKQSQTVLTVEVESLLKSIVKVEYALFGNGTDQEGVITKQAKMNQRLNLVVTVLSFALTTIGTILLTKFLTTS